MLEKKSVFLSAVYSLIAAIIGSLIFLPIFNNFYLLNFNPIKFNSMFSLWSYGFDIKLNSFIFAFSLFLPLSIFIFVQRKQWIIWIIFIIIPFLLALVGGNKHLLWFVIFTLAGGLIGWLINLGIKKLKK